VNSASTPVHAPDPAPESGIAGSRRYRSALVLGVVGEILVTLGIVVLMFIGYQIWWTNVVSNRVATGIANRLITDWADGRGGAGSLGPNGLPAELIKAPAVDVAFGLVYIPKLRDKVWGLPVVEGDSMTQLAEGMAHYPDTAMPGQVGNFALAGHRMTHGARLSNVDHLVAGDYVIIRTKDWWYTYVLDRHTVVTPYDWWVVEPVPGRPGAVPTQAMLTMTTCNPRWQAIQRWVWWGHLKNKLPTKGGLRPAELGA
jgi:sortase A